MHRLHRLLLAALLLPGTSWASQCGINLNYGVVINPKHVRIIDQGQTVVQINNDQQLFIKGREQTLNATQLQALKNYSAGIRKQVPEIIEIALEGVDLGLKTVNKIIAGLTGENSASHQKIQAKFNELQMRLHLRFNQTLENYYIAPQDFADFDEIFAGEFEQEIEDIVSDSVGTILVAVGEAMTNSDEGNFEQRIETIGDRIGNISDDVKLDMKSKSTQLQQKTEQFCQDLVDLNRVESQMQQSIPALLSFDLIETTKEKNKVAPR